MRGLGAGFDRAAAAALLAPLVAVVLGCGQSADVVPVSGVVTLGGRPLAGASVTFQPIQGSTDSHAGASGSAGRTDADGRYELRLIATGASGAIIGKHRVTITTAEASPDNDAKLASGERVPKEWRDGSTTFDVLAEGTTRADFAIP
ncbi:MAG TPA: hypothetical protein VFV87_02560 [Pirellulaceae bacterium]|nr:hypothetical protein [Pirellulaceae bacterium]